MAYRSGMFNSVGGDRKYQALHFAEYFATFIGNGVFPNPSNGLQVYAKENMTVTIKPGKAWINGYYFVNDSDCDLKIENADGVLKRKDRIVLRFDTSTRLITPEIRKGVFSASPAVPAIKRDADAYELALATVSIDKGTVALTQSAITDERLNTTVCGIVHGVVDQVDTATLFSQYQTWYAEKMEQYNTLMTNAETSFNNQLQAQQTAFDSQSTTNQNTFDTQLSDNQSAFDNQTIVNQQTFDDWLASLRTVLDGDVAGNLLNLINSLDSRMSEELTKKIDVAEKGVANGVATLDTDGFLLDEQFNPNREKDFAVGSYTGDGISGRIITLGFKPSRVQINGANQDGNVVMTVVFQDEFNFFMANGSGSYKGVLSASLGIKENGFACDNIDYGANRNGFKYRFVAYK